VTDLAKRWRGLKALVHDAVDVTTDLVGVGHESAARSARAVTDRIEPLRVPAAIVDDVRRLSTNGLLGTIKVVNRVVEKVTDVALDLATDSPETDEAKIVPAVSMRSDETTTGAWISDASIGLLNAAVGDHLSARDNGLDMSMLFRVADHYVNLAPPAISAALPEPSPRVAFFVHGLGTTEWSWCLAAEQYHGDPTTHFGSLLERDLGVTPVFLRYNTGRRVPDNGRLLAQELQRFVDAYPVPIEELTLIGHSMGGLVLRSACHYGDDDGMPWTGLVRRLFCLGSPHAGAPLAKLGHVVGDVLESIDLPGTQITGRIISGRSAGIKDLRHGDVVDEDWLEANPDVTEDTTLLPHASHYFMSATITSDPEHVVGHLVGDLMVRRPSAEGPELCESHFDIETFRYGGVMHHQLQNHPAVYEVIRRVCAGE